MPIAALILSGLMAAGAQPQPAPHRNRPLFVSPMGEPFSAARGGDALADWFAKADQNRDGAITRDEMLADADRFFATLDVNHDGEIDPDEIARYETQIAPRNRASLGLLNMSEPVTAADSNFNRGITVEEFHSAAGKRFDALDVDHRGSLSLDALERIRPAPAARDKRNFDDPSNQLDANADTGG
jgi:Ca2+-binding EF-hand superfamily protein